MKTAILIVVLLLSIGILSGRPGLPQEAAADGDIAIYDVTDLVEPPPPRELRVRPYGNLVFSIRPDYREERTRPLFGDERGAPGGEAPVVFGEDGQDTQGHAAGERLVRLLAEHAQALGVEHFEAAGYEDGLLTWRGSMAAHAAAEELLGTIRAHQSRSFQVECLLAPLDLVDESRGPYLEPAAFERLLGDERTCLLSLRARSGSWTTTSRQETKPFVADIEVNQTGVLPVTNPRIEAPTAGDWLQARALPVPGNDSVWLDLAIGRIRVLLDAEPPGDAGLDLDEGAHERPEIVERLFSLTTVLPPGKPAVVGSFGPGPDARLGPGLAAVVRVREEERPEATTRPADSPLTAFDIRLLLRDESTRRWWWADGVQEAGRESFWERPQAADALLERWAGEGWATIGPHLYPLLALVPPEMNKQIASTVAARVERLSRTLAIRIDSVRLPRDRLSRLRELDEGDGSLGESWRDELAGADSKLESRTFLAVSGEPHALRRASMTSVVAGVENVSGGVNFEVVEVSDPVLVTLGAGWEVRVRADLVPGRDRVRLRIEGVETEVPEVRDVAIRFRSVRSTGGGSPENEEPRTDPREKGTRRTFQLELPVQSVRYHDVRQEIPLDRDVLLDVQADEGPEARLLVARVRRAR